jgi:hypothetical protein
MVAAKGAHLVNRHVDQHGLRGEAAAHRSLPRLHGRFEGDGRRTSRRVFTACRLPRQYPPRCSTAAERGWEEAENRLHVQKALMEYLLLGKIEA